MTYKDIFNSLELDLGMKRYLDTRPVEIIYKSYDVRNAFNRIKKDTINNMPIIKIESNFNYLYPSVEHHLKRNILSSSYDKYSEKAIKCWVKMMSPYDKAQETIKSIFYCLRNKWIWNFIEEVKITEELKKRQSILDLSKLPLEFDFNL